MKKVIALIPLIVLLTSCAGFKGAKLVRIDPGMNKADVMRELGKPTGVGGSGNVEVLHYVEDKGLWQFDYYYVRLVDGKVESYGPESKTKPVTDTDPPLKTAN